MLLVVHILCADYQSTALFIILSRDMTLPPALWNRQKTDVRFTPHLDFEDSLTTIFLACLIDCPRSHTMSTTPAVPCLEWILIAPT